MTSTVKAARLGRAPTRSDAIVAVAAFALTLALLAGGHGASRSLDALGVVLAAFACFPLLLWRRSPLGVFALTAAASATLNALPRRVRLLAGKMAALIGFAAVVLAAAETLTWVAARLLAPSQGVATAKWLSLAAFGDGLVDFGSALFWVSGYALLGMAVAVLVRSVPVALAIGIAWIGPIEHILQDRWGPASRVFPGLLLEAFVAGGTSAVSAGRALVTIAFYVAFASAIGAAVFARRDITA